MTTTLQLGDIVADVVMKDIKNVHLSVYPPSGRVRISAPARMNMSTVRVFAISKLDWIRAQQKKLRDQERETPREYVDRESHYLWGRRYLLSVVEREERASVAVRHSRMVLTVRPGTDSKGKEAIVGLWYREEIRRALPDALARWTPILGVNAEHFAIQQMKTKWGSCNPHAGRIRLNTELAKKPKECLEYVLVHELVHLLEPTHNARFIALMDQFMPDWEVVRDRLNRLPVRHADWRY
jgi:predicted metal-dependent hydrolase